MSSIFQQRYVIRFAAPKTRGRHHLSSLREWARWRHVFGMLIVSVLFGASAAFAEVPERISPAQLRALVLYAPPAGAAQRPASGHDQVRTHDLSLNLASLHPGRRNETVVRRSSLEKHSDDPWFAIDKAQHLAFSFLWTLGTQYAVVNKGGLSERRALPISIGTSAVVGLAKELYDLRMGPPHVFSFRDLAANAVGILLATGFILL